MTFFIAHLVWLLACWSSLPFQRWRNVAGVTFPGVTANKYRSIWRTDGAVCTDVPREHQYIAEIRITGRPQHGVLGKAGLFGLAYRPAPGFKGTDTLSFAFVSNNKWEGGAGQVANVNITIIVE